MKKLYLLPWVLILIFLNSCANQEKLFVSPKLTAIKVDTKESESREITYTIKEDGNVTLLLDDARFITKKLNLCNKDRQKLTIANNAMVKQINLINNRK